MSDKKEFVCPDCFDIRFLFHCGIMGYSCSSVKLLFKLSRMRWATTSQAFSCFLLSRASPKASSELIMRDRFSTSKQADCIAMGWTFLGWKDQALLQISVFSSVIMVITIGIKERKSSVNRTFFSIILHAYVKP